jgi:MFS family permease
MKGRLGALQEREFRLLWLGQSISALGDALVPLALAFAVLHLTGSAAQLGLVMACFWGSRVAFILAGGVWSDRLPRQLVMIGADVVRAATQAVIALAFFTDTIDVWELAASSAIFGAASAFFGPASLGLVPQLVSPERLQQANALIHLSRKGIEIFGPVSAGFLVAYVGFAWIYAVDAITFVLSALCLIAMRLPAAVQRVHKRSFAADVKRGLHEVRERTWIWSAFIAFSMSNIAIATFLVLGPYIAENELGGSKAWGLILTGGPIGAVIGGAVALRWKPTRPLIPAFALSVFVSLQLLALIPPLPIPLLVLAGAAWVFSVAVGNAFWETLLQQHVPRDAISRVSSLDSLVSFIFMPLGFVIAGPLSHRIGVDWTLALAAGLAAAANLGVLAVPSLRNLPRRERPAAESVPVNPPVREPASVA